MEIQVYLKDKHKIYRSFIKYIESDIDTDDYYYQIFIDYLTTQKIFENRHETKLLLYFISKITKNYFKKSDFYKKIERFITDFVEKIKQTFSNFEIFNFFKKQKRILLFLFNKRIIILDSSISNYFLQKKNSAFHFYFYPELKSMIENEERKSIEKRMTSYDPYIFDEFDKKRQTGENETYLCHLIRSDLIEEFISHINRKNISHSSSIKQSIFETNTFLIIQKNTTLIEYAAFYGSIQIFQYLILNEVELESSLWIYAIHGRNNEIIHLLEDNNVVPEDKSYEKCLEESIKCHNNDLANYLLLNYIRNNDGFKNNAISYSFHYHNYEYFKKEIIENKFVFYYACQYDYISLVKLLIKYQEIDINYKNISSLFYLWYFFFLIFFYDILLIFFHISALHLAGERNNKDIIDFLLSINDIEIVSNSFFECKKLEQINLPSFVTYIGENAFEGCTSLKQITIPSSVVEIQNNAFKKCSSLQQIMIPPSIISINDSVFSHCLSLSKITIPAFVTSIGNFSFSYCSSLKEITIPSSVTSIGNSAFSGSSLTKITIPSSVISIGSEVFYYCFLLTDITIQSSISSIEKGTFNSCITLSHFEIPSSTKFLGFEAFRRCKKLNQLSVPISVDKIDDSAFKECTSLQQIKIPSSIKEISKELFHGCSSLTKIVLPSSVTKICNFSFSECISLQQIIIPSSVIEIGNFSFNECSSLSYLKIPDSVKVIGEYAFYGCASLIKVIIPSSVVELKSSAFEKCSSLKSISIPSSLTVINEATFRECSSLKQISIPLSIIKIGQSAFKDCSLLEHVIIPSSIISIENYAFDGCSSLMEISIPSSVSSIGIGAFPENTKVNKNVNICQIN